MSNFLSPFEDFGFLPEEKGLEPKPKDLGGVISSRVITLLKQKLNSSKKSERLAAAWELAKIKNPKVLPLLKKALFAEDDKEVLSELISAFVHYPEKEAVSELARFVFQCQDSDLRKKAVWVMSHFDSSKTALEALRNLLLTDPDAEVRKEAAFALGEIANTEALSALKEALLSDENVKVRQMVVWALGGLKQAGEEYLIRVLHEDSSLFVRRESAWVLGKVKSRRAVGELIEALKRESSQLVLEIILWAVAEISPKSLSRLQFVLEKEYAEKIKAEYIWLLGKYNQKSLLKKLLRLYPGSSVKVKKAFIWSLTQAGGRIAPRYLRQWYKLEKKKSLKEKILWAMGQKQGK